MSCSNIKYSTPVPLANEEITTHTSFMDTLGRPTIVLTALNAVDEWRDRGDIIITYDYPWLAGYRKPITISVALFSVFFTAWVIGNLNVSIGKKR
jgi:oligosaccharyltransferase complex subunit alpha (ribophorin I)